MEKHPLAGKPVKIANGPLKGQYFIIIDWLLAQFQGKRIEKIQKAHPGMFAGLKKRKVPIDGKLIWGKMYPEMNFMMVHDDELRSDLTVIDGGATPVELPPNVAALSKVRKPKVVTTKKKEKTNDSTGASGSDHHSDEPGSKGNDGRSVSGDAVHAETKGADVGEGHADSKAGGGPGGEKPGKA